LQQASEAPDRGMGKGLLFIFFAFLVIFVVLVIKLASWAGPSIQLTTQIKGLGLSTPIEFVVQDSKHNLKRVRVEIEQNGETFTVMDSSLPTPAWWKLWSRAGSRPATFSTRAGRREFPGLKEGRATLIVAATNDSWGRFFQGGRTAFSRELPVRFAPPSVEVLTSQHYVNQAGCDMVLFKVSAGTQESGIQVGKYYFPSWPVKESMPETRLCLFAYPYEVAPSTLARIVARDDAGNQTLASFTYRVFPKKFRKDDIKIDDDFMNRVVPPIMSQTPELRDQGNLLKNFLLVNDSLRLMNARQLVAFSQKTAPHFKWTQPFVPLGNARVEASFADFRTYVYNGQAVDHQTHLGFDLAVVQHTPVVAANDGTVVYAGFFGIYGNVVILDHGCGLQSLYGHLSSVGVKEGETVKRGQVIGHSGQTGLAGGDHLHFTMLLDGVPVNPVEWWDPHWIHDRIEAKLQQYQ
jgi:murein DD-endopeptidase MepM/ murein hydrolase activator NlpD